MRLEKSVLRQKRPDLRAKFKPERVNLMPNEANLKLERAYLGFEGLNLLEMADLRSARTRFPLERLGEWLYKYLVGEKLSFPFLIWGT